MKANKFFGAVLFLSAVTALSAPSAIADDSNKSVKHRHDVSTMRGPGPVTNISVEYSQLPVKAQKFISDCFRGVRTKGFIMKNIGRMTYEMELTNGYELKFNSVGDCIDIEAPDGVSVQKSAVKRILPGNAVSYIKKHEKHSRIEEVEVENGQYRVKIKNKSKHNGGKDKRNLVFDRNGNLISH